MTTETNDTYDTYVVSGVGPYAYTFRIFSETDLTVTALESGDVDPVTLSTALYTVAGVNDEDGGSITLTAGAASTYSGYTLDIRSNVPIEQPTSIKSQGTFAPIVHETAFDRLNRQIQDLARKVRASFRYPDNVSLDAVMTDRSSWLSKYPYINSSGVIEPASSIGSTALTQSIIGETLYPRTAAEIAAGVTPTDYAIPSHDVCGVVLPARYGFSTSATGANNYTYLSNAALVADQAECSILFPGGTFNYTPSAKINIVTAWSGAGKVDTIINVTAASIECFRLTGHAKISDMSILLDGAPKTSGSIGVRFSDSDINSFTGYQYAENLYVDGFEKNIDIGNVFIATLLNVQSANGYYGVYCVPANSGYVTTVKFINCHILNNTRNVHFLPPTNSVEVSFDGGSIEGSTGSLSQAYFENIASLRFGSGFYTEGNSSQPWLELVSVGQLGINGMTNVSGGRTVIGDNTTIANISGYVGQGSNAQLVAGGTTNKLTISDSQFASSGNTYPANTRLINTTINGVYFNTEGQQVASFTGFRANRYPSSGASTTYTSVSTGSATDVYRFLDIGGTLINSNVSGTFYCYCVDNSTSANSATYALDITSNNNTTTDATLTAVRRQVRGTDPGTSATPFSLANDGGSGAIKLQFTKNAAISQVNVVVVFVGLSV